ncbi:heme-binding protein [Pseudomonas alabamensis]|uniref:heme-binding protein n=1 Tax=Pseudomonas alabamensis TaxID=3064349 RepID=UPI003F651ED4
MHSKSVLDHKDIARMLQAARQHADDHHWQVCIAIVDDGGHPLALDRLDGCAPASAYIALEKARSAALGRRETVQYERMVNEGRTAFVTAPHLTPLEGGVPVLVDGLVIGAIGVSGVQAAQDAEVAKVGVGAL